MISGGILREQKYKKQSLKGVGTKAKKVEGLLKCIAPEPS